MWYDLVCLAVVAFSVWRGMSKGFIWQIASIAGILLCFLFAEAVSVVVAPMTGLEPPLSRWVSILGLYVASSFAAFAAARLIQDGLEKAKFEDFDRHLGGGLGFAKGALLCVILSFFMFTLSEKTRETVVHSKSGYASALILHKLDPIMPEGLHKLLDPYVEGFDPDSIAQHLHDHPDHDSTHPPAPVNPNPTTPGFPPVFQPPVNNPALPQNPFGSNAPVPANPNGYSPTPQPQQPNSNPFNSADVQRWYQQFQGNVPPEVQNFVQQTISQVTPADQPALVQQLNTGLPGFFMQMAEQWNKPQSSAQPAPVPQPQPQLMGQPQQPAVPSTISTQDWRQRRAQLLTEIAAIYTPHQEAQKHIMEEVVHSLHGLPDAVTLAVLEDWYSDLKRLHPDPDPATDLTASIDQRIINQLSRAKVSISSLPATLRDRLSGASSFR